MYGMSMILTIILGLIGLGVMVFVHELGHFVAAKMNGVAVEVFSLGWGPKLVGFTHAGTRYQISWFPIGGYCKMKGELVPGIAGGTGEKVPEADPTPAPGSFLAAAPWRRIVIAIFGPLFNLIFAAIIFFVIWWAGFTVYSSDNRVILATDYSLDAFAKVPPATTAGVKTGDSVIAIDGTPTRNFQDILEAVTAAPDRKMVFTVERSVGGSTQTVLLTLAPELDKDTGAGRIGIYAWVDTVIDTAQAGTAAGIAGLHAGDRITSVDGTPVANTIELMQALAKKPAKIDLGFERAGQALHATLVLGYDEKGAANLGLAFASLRYRSPIMGPLAAAEKGLQETGNTVGLTIKGIGLLFRGINLRNAVAGPLRITYYIGAAATSGFQIGIGAGLVSFFRFLAFLSVSLFLMNLLPIPAMDGGQIILFIVEIVRGKPVRLRMVWRIQLIGFSLLIMLSLFVTFSDILFFAGK
jgi:regulator of sigma E protease